MKFWKKFETLNKSQATQTPIDHCDKLLLFLKNIEVTLNWNRSDSSLIYKSMVAARSRCQPTPRKRKLPDEVEKPVVQILQEDDGKEMCFFKSILPEVKKLKTRKFNTFQRRVLHALEDCLYATPSYSVSASSFDFEKPVLQILGKGGEKEMCFFKSILTEVKNLNARLFIMFQRRVILVLTDGLYGEPSDSLPESSSINLTCDSNSDNN